MFPGRHNRPGDADSLPRTPPSCVPRRRREARKVVDDERSVALQGILSRVAPGHILASMGSLTQPSRIANGEDCKEVAYLLERFQVEYGEPALGAEVLASRVRDHIARNLSVFVLAGPRRVGVAQLQFREYLITGFPICHLEALYVVPERRRQGHGRRLMEFALQVARKRGATMAELATTLDDAAARALYESFGFTNFEKTRRPETQMLYYQLKL